MADLSRFNKVCSGFTLIELMVSLVLSLVVLLGVGQAFLVVKVMNDRSSVVGERAEVLSYISNVLSLEVRSSANVSPVSGNVKVNGSGNLQLELYGDFAFGDRYCSGGEFDGSLEYFVEEDGGVFDLMVFYRCGVEEVAESVISMSRPGQGFFVYFENDDSHGLCESDAESCVRMTLCFDNDGSGLCDGEGDDEISFYLSSRKLDA
jgi:prepilin-type N-terminal cleavage/methylation domain-containing protein